MTKRLIIRGVVMLALIAFGVAFGITFALMSEGYSLVSNITDLWNAFNGGLLSALLIVSWVMFAACGFAVGGCVCYVACADITEAADFEVDRVRRLAREARGILQPDAE